MSARLDLTGQTFGRLTVLRYAGGGRGGARWLCECACPARTQRVVDRNSLTSGNTRSCGCLRRESARETAPRLRAGSARGDARAALVARALARLYDAAPDGAFVYDLAAGLGVSTRALGRALATIAAAGVPLARSGRHGSAHVALAVTTAKERAA